MAAGRRTVLIMRCWTSPAAVVPPMSAGVLKVLRRALTLYHPDKNREDARGAEWAATAEELAKMATALLEEYRRKIRATSSMESVETSGSSAV